MVASGCSARQRSRSVFKLLGDVRIRVAGVETLQHAELEGVFAALIPEGLQPLVRVKPRRQLEAHSVERRRRVYDVREEHLAGRAARDEDDARFPWAFLVGGAQLLLLISIHSWVLSVEGLF